MSQWPAERFSAILPFYRARTVPIRRRAPIPNILCVGCRAILDRRGRTVRESVQCDACSGWICFACGEYDPDVTADEDPVYCPVCRDSARVAFAASSSAASSSAAPTSAASSFAASSFAASSSPASSSPASSSPASSSTLASLTVPSFYTRVSLSEVDIEVLAYMPSCIVLQHGDEWRQCCHGRPDVRLLQPRRQIGSFFEAGDFLYETESGYTNDLASAAIDQTAYDNHVLKWGDMVENHDGLLDFAARSASGRHAIDYEALTIYADQMGLARTLAVVSGHQDLVNFAYLHDGGPTPPHSIRASDCAQNRHHCNDLTILRVDSVPNPTEVDQRFVVTSSALYSKRSDLDDPGDKTLVNVCWIHLHDGTFHLHKHPPKPATSSTPTPPPVSSTLW